MARRARILARQYLPESLRLAAVRVLPVLQSSATGVIDRRVRRVRDRNTLLFELLKHTDSGAPQRAIDRLNSAGWEYPRLPDGHPDSYEIALELLGTLIDGRSATAMKIALSNRTALEVRDRLGDDTTARLHKKAVRPFVEKLHHEGHVRAAQRVAELGCVEDGTDWLRSFRDRRANEAAVFDAGEATISATRGSRLVGTGSASSLYLLHNSLPDKSGGYATRTHGILQGLQSHGVVAVGLTRPGFPAERRVFDQVRNTPPTHVIDGITYHRSISDKQVMPRSDLQAFANHYADLAEPWMRHYRPHVIHAASNWWNGFGGLALARRFDVPFVYEVRGLWELTRGSREPDWMHSEAYQLDAIYEASVAKAADRVITISGALKKELVERGVSADKIVVAPNATNTEIFAPRKPDQELLRELDMADRCVFGFAGTLTAYEGLDLLLLAAAGLRNSGVKGFGLLIVGDGPDLEGLRTIAAENNISDLVRFVGRVPHQSVPRYLSIMDVTPFPRLPLPVCEMVPPIKPLESMAMERTVIVSSVAALAEGVKDNENGLIFDAGSSDALESTMRLLIEDPELRSRLAAEGLHWVRTHRSWHEVTKSIAGVYEDLIGRG